MEKRSSRKYVEYIMMEYVDVLDIEGNKTGKVKAKDECHRDGDWHLGINVWIVNPRQELLVQKRSPHMNAAPNKWDASTSGHVSAGEESIDTAQKEVREELGLELKKSDFEFLFRYKNHQAFQEGKFIENGFTEVFLVEKDVKLTELTLDKNEVADAKFIEFHELEKTLASGDNEFIQHTYEYARLFKLLHERFSKIEV